MIKVKKLLGFALLAVLLFFGLVIGKWYRTVTSEPIHPQWGVYGMDGPEVWIDLNAIMLEIAREGVAIRCASVRQLFWAGKTPLQPMAAKGVS